MSEFDAEGLSPLRVAPFGSPDLSRPECRNLHQTIQDQKRQLSRWSDRYQSATSYEAKQEAARNIEQINDRISYYEDQMHDLGCYEMPTTVVRLLVVDRPELTQSTQYYAKGGTGAGADNSVFLVEGKALLVRVNLTSLLTEGKQVNGFCDVMGYNETTLKYDTLRRRITASNTPALSPSGTSQRGDMWEHAELFRATGPVLGIGPLRCACVVRGT